jgi:hypothetical protein
VLGRWSGKDGVSHQVAIHNATVGMTWFAPSLAIGSRLGSPSVVTSYLGEGFRDDQSVYHLRLIAENAGMSPNDTATMSALSAMEVYVSTATSLPVALAFNIHPDNNLRVDIPIEVDFSDYRIVQGAAIPYHIEKYVNGTLLLDLTVESAVINSGLTSSQLEAQ